MASIGLSWNQRGTTNRHSMVTSIVRMVAVPRRFSPRGSQNLSATPLRPRRRLSAYGIMSGRGNSFLGRGRVSAAPVETARAVEALGATISGRAIPGYPVLCENSAQVAAQAGGATTTGHETSTPHRDHY